MNEALKLVAPWWYWERQRPLYGPPRSTRPTIQKFDEPDFVEGFAKSPQRSLKFVDEDFVYTYQAARRSGLSTVLKSLKPLVLDEAPVDAAALPLMNSGTRKLFLDVHKRHYVVVCELRCEAPGFPREKTDDVCQAGFVIRRQLLHYEPANAAKAKQLLLEIGDLQRNLADFAESRTLTRWGTTQRAQKNLALKVSGAFASAVSTTAVQLKAKRAELLDWQASSGSLVVEEGWFEGDHAPLGSWQVMDDATPAVVDEQWYPLYPLHDDPAMPFHEARKHTLYFGVIPTTAFECDSRGIPKLDSSSVYQLRCFVRQHKADCPRTDEVPDCQGAVFWSGPTEAYRLAGANDLVGTSHRAVTIELPDLDELAALATPANLGKFSPVRAVAKQPLFPGSLGIASICFFSIPLITIVAMFVLSIFLPIVVLLFGLWFLLLLKFCIPPSIDLGADVLAEIDAANLLPDIDAAASLTYTDSTGTVVTRSMTDVTNEVSAALGAAFASQTSDLGIGKAPSMPSDRRSLFDIGAGFSAVGKLAAASPDGENPALDLSAGLEWETPLTVEPSPT
ncbi:MAG: hypothetical protein QM723_40325 [Myxococcaceae bacterium]